MTTAGIQHHAAMEFLEASPDPVGRTVMDVGCGDGFAALQFVNRDAKKVYANDLRPDEDKMTDLKPNSEFLQGIQFVPMNDRSLYDGKLDLVWCHHCLEHQERPIDFLKELRALLKPHGELWLAVPNMRENINLSLGHTMAYNMPLLVEHLKRASFDVEKGAYWRQRGHLRVRLGILKAGEMSEYPKPMREAFKSIGRCPAEVVHNWNWFPEAVSS